jgi:hypothetical protein
MRRYAKKDPRMAAAAAQLDYALSNCVTCRRRKTASRADGHRKLLNIHPPSGDIQTTTKVRMPSSSTSFRSIAVPLARNKRELP